MLEDNPAMSSSKTLQNVPAIVLGSGITLLATIRCLGRRGVVSLCPCKAAMTEDRSRWFHPLGAGEPITEKDNLETFLNSIAIQKAVLIPCSDQWTRHVAALSPKLRERFPTSLSSLELQDILTDKGKFRDLLRQHNVPHPNTIFPDKEDDVETLNDADFKTYFLKPRDSQSFSHHYGVKGFWQKSREDCKKQLKDVQDAGFEVVLQEYIPGPPDQHYYVEGFVDRNGVFSATLGRQRIRMAPPDFGNSTYMRSVALSTLDRAVQSTKKLLTAVKYRGIYSAEFKYDSRDSEFKLIEINARPWWYVEFSELCGINNPYLAYLDALELDVPIIEEYTVGSNCINFLADFSLWRRYLRAGKIKPWNWIRSWFLAHPTICRLDDPTPGAAWMWQRVFSAGQSK